MVAFTKLRNDPPLTAYVKIPEGKGPFPLVIIFMHRPGADKSQQKVADDLMKAGYVAILHDSYRDNTIKNSYTDDTIFEDFEYTLNWVKENIKQIDSSRFGILGFCMGGRHSYLAATKYSDIKAVVSYYGFPAQGTDDNNIPMKLVKEMNIPILGIFGKQDHLYPFTDVEKFRSKLLRKSDKNKVCVYTNVGHGFLNPFSKRFGNGESAGKAWDETLEFYKKNL